MGIVGSRMGEGGTPCVQSARHGSALYFKLEQCNPSGSYKDRFIARELDVLLAGPSRLVVATSSGNTGASLAAYAARFGLHCVIFANADAPTGKLAQMRSHGACVVRVPAFASDMQITADVFGALSSFSEAEGVPLVVSAYRYCPHGMSGVEEIGRELEALTPQHVFVPVGGGGLYSAVARALAGQSGTRVHAVQPAGCGTVVDAWRDGRRVAAEVQSTTSISGLSVPFDIDASRALGHLYDCGGLGIGVTDAEILEAQRQLLTGEGIYCEPAGAAAYAGWRKATAEGLVDAGERSVCLVTGHGFKDPQSIEAAAARVPSPLIDPEGVLTFLESVLQLKESPRHA